MENPADFGSERWKKLSRIAYFKAFSVLSHQTISEDVSQEAIAKYLERYEEIDSPEKWISVVAQNLAKDALMRKSGIFQARPIQDQDPENEAEEVVLKNVGYKIVDDLTTSKIVIDKNELDNALENLSEKEQLIVSLSADGYSQGEIAEILGYKDSKVVANLLRRVRVRVNKKD